MKTTIKKILTLTLILLTIAGAAAVGVKAHAYSKQCKIEHELKVEEMNNKLAHSTAIEEAYNAWQNSNNKKCRNCFLEICNEYEVTPAEIFTLAQFKNKEDNTKYNYKIYNGVVYTETAINIMTDSIKNNEPYMILWAGEVMDSNDADYILLTMNSKC